MRLVNKRVLESLVKAGALDSLCPGNDPPSVRRARLFAAVDRALEHGGRHQRDREKGQNQLFGGGFDTSEDRRRARPRSPRCPMRRRGPKASSWRARRKRWAST